MQHRQTVSLVSPARFSPAQGVAALGMSWLVASLAVAFLFTFGLALEVYGVLEPRPHFYVSTMWLTVYGYLIGPVSILVFVAGLIALGRRRAGSDQVMQAARVGLASGLFEAAIIGLIAASGVHWLAIGAVLLSLPAVITLGGRPPR